VDLSSRVLCLVLSLGVTGCGNRGSGPDASTADVPADTAGVQSGSDGAAADSRVEPEVQDAGDLPDSDAAPAPDSRDPLQAQLEAVAARFD
jgi:hypothetical protein